MNPGLECLLTLSFGVGGNGNPIISGTAGLAMSQAAAG